YEQKGQFDKAIAAFEKAITLDDNLMEGKAQLGHVYAVAGRHAEAKKMLTTLTELAKRRYISPYNIAVLHAGLGNKNQAFNFLEEAAKDHSEWFAYLRVDPRLEPLRADPRFAGLLKH